MSQLMPLEHRILAEFRRRGLEDMNVLVALSGGLDSMALLHIVHAIAPLLKLHIFVGHIHHGWVHGAQGSFRKEAWKLCRKISQSLNLSFYSNLLAISPSLRFMIEPETPLRSEGELRSFRYKCLYQFQRQLHESLLKKTYIATAHTANDQLETRLIQLIRGTGQWGVQAMNFVNNENLLRPLLHTSRDELSAYLKIKKVKFIDDPTNLYIDPFRNWLRNEWLVQLEKKRAGAINSLSRSLSLLAQANFSSAESLERAITDKSINYPLFLELNFEEKKRALAYYMRKMNMKNYSQSHILEIIKRLDTPEKEHRFTLLRHQWTVNAEQIKASPV